MCTRKLLNEYDRYTVVLLLSSSRSELSDLSLFVAQLSDGDIEQSL